jgi:hypothetical protein
LEAADEVPCTESSMRQSMLVVKKSSWSRFANLDPPRDAIPPAIYFGR